MEQLKWATKSKCFISIRPYRMDLDVWRFHFTLIILMNGSGGNFTVHKLAHMQLPCTY